MSGQSGCFRSQCGRTVPTKLTGMNIPPPTYSSSTAERRVPLRYPAVPTVVVAWEETKIRVEFPTTARVLPSPEKATEVQLTAGKPPRWTQVAPESDEM